MSNPHYHPKGDRYCLRCKSVLEKVWYAKYYPAYHCAQCDETWSVRSYNIIKKEGIDLCFYCETILDKHHRKGHVVYECPSCHREWDRKEFVSQREAYQKLRDWNRKATS